MMSILENKKLNKKKNTGISLLKLLDNSCHDFHEFVLEINVRVSKIAFNSRVFFLHMRYNLAI